MQFMLIKFSLIRHYGMTTMIKFRKSYIVHTSDFGHLEIHEGMVHRFEIFTDDKGIVVLATMLLSFTFSYLFPNNFISHQSWTIGCVNYAYFANWFTIVLWNYVKAAFWAISLQHNKFSIFYSVRSVMLLNL